jgi:hypothetical protein
MAALRTSLEARAGATLRLRELHDADATRDALVTAFRDHLGRAGPDDVALFAFFGHGSEEPAPPEIATLEPTGRLQTILLHDCGRRIGGTLRRAFADKELSLLLAEVAASGAHVVTILDCCHSGGGTRDPFARPRGWQPRPERDPRADRDVLVELAAARPVTEFLPGALDRWAAPRPPHVALAACRSDELAKEHRVGRHHAWRVLGGAGRCARRPRHPHDLPLPARHGAGPGRAHDGGPAPGAAPRRRRRAR